MLLPRIKVGGAGVPVALGLLAALAACGSPAHASTTSTASRQAQQQKAQAAFNAMSSCLTKAGYHFVGPPPDEMPANMKIVSNNAGDDQLRTDPGYKKAYDKCAASTGFKQFTSSQAGKQPSVKDIQKNNRTILKIYACMRQKGWTLADPTKGVQGQLSPPMPPSDVQGSQARMSQFGNDLNSCSKASGGGGVFTTQNGGGGGGSGVSLGG